MGGSATTDGGRGCLEVLEPHARLRGIELLVACDVMTRFVDAAEVFGPQKGASPAQVQLLKRRLERLAQIYEEDLGVDVRDLPGSGAAGGLAGGLAPQGAAQLPGFELVAEQIDLAGRMEHADLVITGEGYLDDQSFNGKAVGGVLGLAREFDVPCLVICGDSDPGTPVPVLNLVSRYGEERAMGDTIGCIEEIATEWLEGAGEDIRLHGRIGGGPD
jgi:glycerate kinase